MLTTRDEEKLKQLDKELITEDGRIKLEIKTLISNNDSDARKEIQYTYVVNKDCKYYGKHIWILNELPNFAFMIDQAGHGNGEKAQYKIFEVKKTKLILLASLSNKNKIMFKKRESNYREEYDISGDLRLLI